MRLIDADALRNKFIGWIPKDGEEWGSGLHPIENLAVSALMEIDDAPTVDVLPLKIGDEAWVIRNFNGTKHVKKGKVTAMVYTQKMELCVTVGKLALGRIGEKVFLTKEDAEMAIMKGEEQ